MTIFLRQSTASQEVLLGRFVDSVDGNTEETGLTIANTDIKVWKTGATSLANKNSGGGTHIANGVYYCVLDATDTDTIGPLELHVHVAGALYVKQVCTVLDEAVYDVLFGTTAISTLAGTAQTGDCFARLGAPAGASVSADVAAVKSQTAAIETDTQDIQSRLPAALTGGGNIKADALAISGDTTAADNAEAFFDGTGYAGTNNVIPSVTAVGSVSGAVGSVTGNVGGSVAGSVASVSATVNANVTQVNSVTVGGAGTSGDPWGPA